jgi:lipoprotein-anchoring transpeptidase ErfK/SrfK
MKLKSLAITLIFIITFSLTACKNNSSTKEKIDYDIKNEKIVKEENSKIVTTDNDKFVDSENSIESPSNSLIIAQPNFEEFKPVVLKLGASGEIVRMLQVKLNKFGYSLNLDGNFGQQTLNAIFDFQRRNNIALNEIVDEETISKLDLPPTKDTTYNPKDDIYNPALKSNKAEKLVNAKESNSPTQYYIWVDTNSPRVYIFEGYNRQWKLLKDIPCTVGQPSTPTIKGTFNIGIKGDSFIVRDNPKLKCDYYTQISGNYLFHTVLLYRNGKIADGRLGLKLSHGCVRLSIPDAKYIYDNIPTGTTVYVS